MNFGQVTIRNSAGAVIRPTSRNLRGILDYTRGAGVAIERADLFPHKGAGGGTLGVTWNTGATCVVDFADYEVMREWVNARRCFKGAQIKEAPKAEAKGLPLAEFFGLR